VVKRCALAACRVFTAPQASITSMRMLQAIFTQARKSNRTQKYEGNRLWKPSDSVPRRRVVFATTRTETGHPRVWPVGDEIAGKYGSRTFFRPMCWLRIDFVKTACLLLRHRQPSSLVNTVQRTFRHRQSMRRRYAGEKTSLRKGGHKRVSRERSDYAA